MTRRENIWCSIRTTADCFSTFDVLSVIDGRHASSRPIHTFRCARCRSPAGKEVDRFRGAMSLTQRNIIFAGLLVVDEDGTVTPVYGQPKKLSFSVKKPIAAVSVLHMYQPDNAAEIAFCGCRDSRSRIARQAEPGVNASGGQVLENGRRVPSPPRHPSRSALQACRVMARCYREHKQRSSYLRLDGFGEEKWAGVALARLLQGATAVPLSVSLE